MTFAFISPESARVAIPVALAVAYAAYHWWRWRMMHPKIVVAELPKPASEVVPVKPKEGPADEQEKETAQTDAQPEPAASEPPPQKKSRWEERRKMEQAEEQFAREACDISHLMRLHRLARRRRPELFVRLGEYSWHRGAMIETHFWVSLAKINGVEGLDEWLHQIRTRWLQSGCRREEDNEYELYPLRRSVLAQALMMCATGKDLHINHDVIVDFAQHGDRDARAILAAEQG